MLFLLLDDLVTCGSGGGSNGGGYKSGRPDPGTYSGCSFRYAIRSFLLRLLFLRLPVNKISSSDSGGCRFGSVGFDGGGILVVAMWDLGRGHVRFHRVLLRGEGGGGGDH